MDTPVPVDLGRIAQDLQIRRVQVENVVALLDSGDTIPFIARHRRERTQGLSEPILREIAHRVRRLRELAERKEMILKTLRDQEKSSEELETAIRSADHPKRLEDLYLPYKPKARTAGTEAREKGLEALALRIWNRDETLIDLKQSATELISPEKGLESAEQVLEGTSAILAESISELALVRDVVRRVVQKLGRLASKKAESVPETGGQEYRDYFAFSEPLPHVALHRVLTINRGAKDGILTVHVEAPRGEIERALLSQIPLEGHPQGEFFRDAALVALDRYLLPSFEQEIRRDLTELAERHAIEVFGRNLRNLILQPPVPPQPVLAIDPGFKNGCKVAVLDAEGKLLDHATIFPHQPQNKRHEAKTTIKNFVAAHQVALIAVGNGAACRETEELLSEIIAEGTHFHENPGVPFPVKTKPPLSVKQGDSKSQSAMPTEQSIAGETDTEPATPVAAESSESQSLSGLDSPVSATDSVHADSEPSTEAGSPNLDPTSEPLAPDRGIVTETSAPVRDEDTPPPVSGGSPDDETASGDSQQTGSGEPFDMQGSGAGEITSSEHSEETAPVTNEGPGDGEHATESPSVSAGSVEGSSPSELARDDTSDAIPTEGEDSGSGSARAEDLTVEGTGSDLPEETPASTTADTATTGSGDSAPAAVSPSMDLLRPPKGSKSAAVNKPIRPKQPPPIPEPHAADPLLARLAYVVVSEAGVAAYAASPIAKEEFPDADQALRSAISLGRRLQDPLAEFAKVDPQQVAAGLHHNDIQARHLRESVEEVLEGCVNQVGVDLNRAGPSVLKRIAGLNAILASRIIERRSSAGAFTRREQLLEVEGVSPATYAQAAGFVRIQGGENPLDATSIHPERYEICQKVLEKLGVGTDALLNPEQRGALSEHFRTLDLVQLAQEYGLAEPALDELLQSLAEGNRDLRDEMPTPLFKRGILKLEELEPGSELKGTVLNVVDFGAFVDVGLKDSGLVHISQLANRYVKSPHDVVSVGDIVTTWVLAVDRDKKRVSLTMVKPGTERTRPPERRGQTGSGGPGPGGGRDRDRGGSDRPHRGGGDRRPPRGRGDAPVGGSRNRSDRADDGGSGASSEPGSSPVEEKRVNLRIPGPPQRLQNRDRGGRRSGPPRAGGRGGNTQAGTGQGDRLGETPKPKPRVPAPAPAQLPQGAMTGSVPLRSFGQLKQLFEERSKPAEESKSTDTITATSDMTPDPGTTGERGASEASSATDSTGESAEL
jgi:uncharacterized protein